MKQHTDAVNYAMEMMTIPLQNVPIEALKYLAFLGDRIGICGDVYVFVYAIHGQIAEKLPCDDEAYKMSSSHQTDYEQAQLEYERIVLENGNWKFRKIPGK